MTSSIGKFRSNLIDPFDDKNYNIHFNELYTPLCQYALKFVNDIEVAEDIVQDNFVYLWENWSRLSKIDSIKAYLFTAVKNKSLSYLQKQFVRQTIHKIDDYKDSIVDLHLPTALELLECKDLEQILEKALQQLPERCRIIFSMKRFGEKSNKEIAEDLNISVKTVEAQMTIAIKKMSAYVNAHWDVSVVLFFNIIINLSKKK